MQISPIKANNNNYSFGIKKQETPYNKELDGLILEYFGNLVPVRSSEDCNRFLKATEDFKKGNEELLEKHFNVIV